MLKKIICSGYGGQGVLTLGMILARAATEDGKNITWVPSYGSEMMGGAANCEVKISDEPIVGPFISKTDVLVAMSEASLEKYGGTLQDGSCVVVNSSIMENVPEYENCTVLKIPANEIAMAHGNMRGVGLAIVGGVIAYTDLVPLDVALKAVEEYFGSKKANTELNRAVFMDGYEYVKNLM